MHFLLKKPLQSPSSVAVNEDVSGVMVVVMVVMCDSGRSMVPTRFIDFNLAKVPGVCGVADASESVDAVNALSIVLARVGGALVNVDIAIHTLEARSALALVAVESIDALATVHARAVSAIVDVSLAGEAGEALRALAYEIVDAVVAVASVVARV